MRRDTNKRLCDAIVSPTSNRIVIAGKKVCRCECLGKYEVNGFNLCGVHRRSYNSGKRIKVADGYYIKGPNRIEGGSGAREDVRISAVIDANVKSIKSSLVIMSEQCEKLRVLLARERMAHEQLRAKYEQLEAAVRLERNQKIFS